MGYCCTLQTISYDRTTIIMEIIAHMKVSIDLEFDAPKLVKVKAHTRHIGDKVVKVRWHYRRVWGRKVDAFRIH